MAVFKIITGKYEGEISIARVLHYILDPKKNPGGIHNVYSMEEKDIDDIVEEFVKVQELYRKTNGKRIIHMVLSFSEYPPYMREEYGWIGNKIVEMFKGYQTVFSLHERDNDGNRKQPHIHVAVNSISYLTGKRLHISKTEIKELKSNLENIK